MKPQTEALPPCTRSRPCHVGRYINLLINRKAEGRLVWKGQLDTRVGAVAAGVQLKGTEHPLGTGAGAPSCAPGAGCDHRAGTSVTGPLTVDPSARNPGSKGAPGTGVAAGEECKLPPQGRFLACLRSDPAGRQAE